MREVYIRLSSVDMVRAFVNTVDQLDGGFNLIAERRVLDAKSILGIFSLKLSNPLLLRIEKDTNENMTMLKDYIVQSED